MSIVHPRSLLLGAASLALSAGIAASAAAQGFFGFDPANFSGEMLGAQVLEQMKEAAMKVSPPKNGENYVFAFANLQRDIVFGIRVEEGIVANAEAAGIKTVIADNRLDGPTALANAESFVRRNVDYVIEFQTDVAFGPTIMQRFNDAAIPVTAIDIPMPGATFFGANNPKSGFMGGSYLAQAAVAEFGADAVKEGFLVVGELPQSGAIPAMRTGGQVGGFTAVLPDFPEDHIIFIDTKNTLQVSFEQMSNVIGRIPEGVPIMVIAINDQSTTGMLRAAKQAGREDVTIAVGMGADETETLIGEPRFVASVGFFPERYGNYLLPVSFMALAGEPVPPSVLISHVMVTTENVCEFYDEFACSPADATAPFTFEFPQAAFEAFLADLRTDPDLQDVLNLIPKS